MSKISKKVFEGWKPTDLTNIEICVYGKLITSYIDKLTIYKACTLDNKQSTNQKLKK